MSQNKSSHGRDNPRVGARERTTDDSADKDRSVRERVLKEVGLTSTSFIGPAFPPKTTKVKSDIEDTLSEFYKELEKIDTAPGANGDPGKQDAGSARPHKTPTSRETRDAREERIVNTSKCAEIDGYQKSSGHRQPSWPHWYQNEPYYARRARPGVDPSSGRAAPSPDQGRYPQTPDTPPNPRFHRPPFHRPPPEAPFPNRQNPQNPPSNVNQNWSGSVRTNQYHEESHFPTFSDFPPPNVGSHPSQGLYGDYPHHFDKDERRRYDAHSENVNVGWPRDRKEEWCQFGEDYDRRRRYDSDNELWEHHCQPPDNPKTYHSSLVLVLMRGLPGSGKSTLARYVFV